MPFHAAGESMNGGSAGTRRETCSVVQMAGRVGRPSDTSEGNTGLTQVEGEFFALMEALKAFRAGPLSGDPSDRVLARAVGMSPTTVGDWLRGTRFPQDVAKVLTVVRMVRQTAVARNVSGPSSELAKWPDENRWRVAYQAEAQRRAGMVSEAVQRAQAVSVLARPAGRPLSEVSDPFALEVHRPVQLEDSQAGLPVLPDYVRRDHDVVLSQIVAAAAAGQSGIAVLVGGEATGKTRACWEALAMLRDQHRGWRVWHPVDPSRPDAALRDLATIEPRTVVWLNEAQFYLGIPDSDLGERVAGGIRELLRDPARAPVLVLATMWPQYWKTLTIRPETAADQHAQARELLTSRDIPVPTTFPPADLQGLKEARDPRLAMAAAAAPDGQIIQYLAGAPELLTRYRNAPPAAAALINAAMDARRLGTGIGLPYAFLAEATPGYLTSTEWELLGEDWLEQVLAYTALPCKGIRGPLTRIHPQPTRLRAAGPASLDSDEQLPSGSASIPGMPLYRLADYLDQYGRRHRQNQLPPASFWMAAARHALPGDQAALGTAAHTLGLYHYATQLRKNTDAHTAFENPDVPAGLKDSLGDANVDQRRVRVGEMPPLAEGFSDRPDTARGILDALAPSACVALVPGSEIAEGKQNWLGSGGKTQIAVILAESLWQSRAIDMLVWINASNRASVLSALVQAAAAAGIEPMGTAESVAARFVSWLAETDQPWLVVLDDLQDPVHLDGLWPEGPAGRLLITSSHSTVVASRHRTRVFPVGFFSVREALGCLTERLSVNPAQRQGAIDLIVALGREPLALGQAAAVIANSTLACRDYRDYFARRLQQIEAAAGELPSAASVTWTLSLGQAEMLLPGQSVRLMLVLIALLDGHGIPGMVFDTQSVSVYLGGTAVGFGTPVDSKPAWDALLAIERAGLITISRAEASPRILMSSVVQAAIRLAAPSALRDRAARTAANALLEAWPIDEPHPWTAVALRANAVSLQNAATHILWAEGCHPLLLRAGRSLDSGRLVGPALEYWRELSVHCDNKLPPEHPDALVVAAQVAGAYLAAGYGAEAVTWYRRVLAERSANLAPGHPAVIAARVSLAEALIAAGELADAVTVLRRAVSESEQFRGPGHPDTLAARDELARAYEAAGDVTAAIGLLTQTLAERNHAQGPCGVQTMATRDRLAAAMVADGKIKQAIADYKRVLADREAVLGHDHPDTIATKASLAAAYHASRKMVLAVRLSEQACADSERVLGADHVDTLSRQANLAILYYTVGRVRDARKLLRDTVARSERVLPHGDPLIQTFHQVLVAWK